jgi:hypothetical protein
MGPWVKENTGRPVTLKVAITATIEDSACRLMITIDVANAGDVVARRKRFR